MLPKEVPLRIALIEDHALFRESMKALIETSTPHKVVLMAGDGQAYEEMCEHIAPPDVALVDLHMPVRDGFATIAWIREHQKETLPLACSFELTAPIVRRALKAGSRGYLPKNCDAAQLRDALEQLRTLGNYYSTLEQEHRAANEAHERGCAKVMEALDARELELVRLLCDERGLTLKRIADELGLGLRTVEGECGKLYEKLGVSSRVGLIVAAVRWEVVKV